MFTDVKADRVLPVTSLSADVSRKHRIIKHIFLIAGETVFIFVLCIVLFSNLVCCDVPRASS